MLQTIIGRLSYFTIEVRGELLMQCCRRPHTPTVGKRGFAASGVVRARLGKLGDGA